MIRQPSSPTTMSNELRDILRTVVIAEQPIQNMIEKWSNHFVPVDTKLGREIYRFIHEKFWDYTPDSTSSAWNYPSLVSTLLEIPKTLTVFDEYHRLFEAIQAKRLGEGTAAFSSAGTQELVHLDASLLQ